MGKLCPRFFETTELIRESSLIFELEKKHRKLFSLVSKNTGLDMSNSKNIADLYKNLEARVCILLSWPLTSSHCSVQKKKMVKHQDAKHFRTLFCTSFPRSLIMLRVRMLHHFFALGLSKSERMVPILAQSPFWYFLTDFLMLKNCTRSVVTWPCHPGPKVSFQMVKCST